MHITTRFSECAAQGTKCASELTCNILACKCRSCLLHCQSSALYNYSCPVLIFESARAMTTDVRFSALCPWSSINSTHRCTGRPSVLVYLKMSQSELINMANIRIDYDRKVFGFYNLDQQRQETVIFPP